MVGWIIERLLQLIPSLTAFSKERRELHENALRAINHALDETCIYYRNIELGKPRDQEVEAQLVRYWSAAAIPMRHIDPELAERCDRKSEYWLNPERHEHKQVLSMGIDLETVRKKYRSLLHPKRPALRRPSLSEINRQPSTDAILESKRPKKQRPKAEDRKK